MTSSLGVEVTPGRFRSLVTAARSLVEQRDADLLESLGLGGRPARRAPGRPGRDARPARRGPVRRPTTASWPSCSPAPRRSAGASPTPCAAAARSARSWPRTGGPRPTPTAPAARRARCRPPRTWPRTCTASRRAERRRGRLGRRDAAQRPAAPLPHRRRPRALGDALGRGHVGADQRDHPAADRRAGRVSRTSPPRSSTWAARSTTAPTRCSTWPGTCPTAAPPAPRRRSTRSSPSCSRPRAGAPSPSSPAGGPPRRRPSALAPELPYTLLLQGDLPEEPPARGVRRPTRPPACSPRMGFWQGVDIPGRALSLVTIDRLPFPRPDDPCSRRAGTGPAAAPSPWSTCPGRPRCWPRARAGSSATRTTGAWSPCSIRGSATASYRGVLLATLPPMRRSVDIHEVESFLRRALEDPAA